MEIVFGKECEIENWMQLVHKVKDSFPGLETKEALEEYRNTVLDFLRRNEAICAKNENQIVGVLLFSRETQMLCFLAVDADYRRQHIAEKMVACMLTVWEGEKR